MAKIKIADIAKDAKISRDEMKQVMGGSITNLLHANPVASVNNMFYGTNFLGVSQGREVFGVIETNG